MASKASILEAARGEFALHGYSARLQDIAERAGLTHPTLLYHFKSKERLYAAVIEQAGRALGVELQRLVQRLLERDRGGAVDDDVDAGRELEALVAEVAADDADPAAVEPFAGAARQNLVVETLLGVAAQQQHDLGVGQLPQDLTEHGFSEESRGPGEQDGLAGQLLLDEDVVRQSEHRTSRLY